MVRLTWNNAPRRTAAYRFYSVWTQTSCLTLVLSAVAFASIDSWISYAGLSFTLIALLLGGTFLLVLGIRDLVRDFRRFLHARPH